eukprot:g18962.t2
MPRQLLFSTSKAALAGYGRGLQGHVELVHYSEQEALDKQTLSRKLAKTDHDDEQCISDAPITQGPLQAARPSSGSFSERLKLPSLVQKKLLAALLASGRSQRMADEAMREPILAQL